MRNFQTRTYKDRDGYLVTSEKDGGDTAFFTGHYFIGLWLKMPYMREHYGNFFKKKLSELEVPGHKGNYRRHPKKGWASEPDRMSRDQMTPLIIAMGFYGFTDSLNWFTLRWLTRFMFMTNTRRNGATKENHGTNGRDYSFKLPDFSPTFSGLLIRAYKIKLLYPILFILDLELLLGAIKNIYWASESGDDHNFIARLFQAEESFPTPISSVATKLYGKRKQMKHQKVFDYKTNSHPQRAIQHYAARGNFKYPPLDVLFKSMVESKWP